MGNAPSRKHDPGNIFLCEHIKENDQILKIYQKSGIYH